jgi:hypothetical protein
MELLLVLENVTKVEQLTGYYKSFILMWASKIKTKTAN